MKNYFMGIFKRCLSRMGVLLWICGFLTQCHPPSKKQWGWDLVSGLVEEKPVWTASFSYPGRNQSLWKKEAVKRKIIQIVRDTEEELVLHIYGLTDVDIVREIARARDRGVSVKITGDRDRRYTDLESYQIPIHIWAGSGLYHPKVLVSDRRRIFTGTGNFTNQGLLTDYDSYLDTEVSPAQGTAFLDFVDGSRSGNLHSLGSLNFLNSPDNGLHIQKHILDSIRGAEREILYLIYTHYDPVVSFELVRAAKRGVRVEGIYNRPINPEGKYLARLLPRWGSAIYEEENEDRIDDGNFGLGGLLHHKTMIIDRKKLLSGSYNYSASARDGNREVYYFTEDRQLVADHIDEFLRVRSASKVYREPSENHLRSKIRSESTTPGDTSPTSEGNEVFATDPDLGSEPGSQPSPLVVEWGRGSFRSIGIRSMPSANLPYRAISSGLFAGGRFAIDEDYLESGDWFHWEGEPMESTDRSVRGGLGLFGIGGYIPNTKASLGSETGGKTRINLRESTNIRFAQGILWSGSGKLTQAPLTVQPNGVLQWGLSVDSLSEGQGVVFLQDDLGQIQRFFCYRRRNLGLKREFRFFLMENSLANPNGSKGRMADCGE